MFFFYKAKSAVASDSITGGVAIASIFSPAWLPFLSDVSSFAGLLMPIFGVTWLIVQIYAKLREIGKKPKE